MRSLLPSLKHVAILLVSACTLHLHTSLLGEVVVLAGLLHMVRQYLASRAWYGALVLAFPASLQDAG